MTRPLVSVITPTYRRPALLEATIHNVRAQTYRPLEHVVVIDGQDVASATICDLAEDEAEDRCGAPDEYDFDFVELGHNWSSFLPDSFCAAPMIVGQLAARGTYQTWLADDEMPSPDHIEQLVDALEAASADLAYSRVELYRPDGPRWTIGTDPPRQGQITNVLYRVELLKLGLYPLLQGMTSDWACISRWLAFGARYAFVDAVTLSHRVDH